MTTTPIVTSVLTTLTVIGNIGLILFFLNLLVFKKSLPKRFSGWATPLAFMVALISTGGSLFYSEIALYVPCKLCWFQRIFMSILKVKGPSRRISGERF